MKKRNQIRQTLLIIGQRPCHIKLLWFYQNPLTVGQIYCFPIKQVDPLELGDPQHLPGSFTY